MIRPTPFIPFMAHTKDSNRPRRVAELLKRELAMMIPRELPGDIGRRITITDAEAAPDLKTVRVYFSMLGGAAEAADILPVLKQAAPHLRHLLKPRLSLRYIPELRFYFDESLERGDRIDRLLASIHKPKTGQD